MLRSRLDVQRWTRAGREAGGGGGLAKPSPSFLAKGIDKAGSEAPSPGSPNLPESFLAFGHPASPEPCAHAPGLGATQCRGPPDAGTLSCSSHLRDLSRCTKACSPTILGCHSRSFNGKFLPPRQACHVQMHCHNQSGLLLLAQAENSSVALGCWLTLPLNAKFLECSGNPPGACPHFNNEPKTATATYIGLFTGSVFSPNRIYVYHTLVSGGYILMKTNTSREVIKFRVTDEPREKLLSELQCEKKKLFEL